MAKAIILEKNFEMDENFFEIFKGNNRIYITPENFKQMCFLCNYKEQKVSGLIQLTFYVDAQRWMIGAMEVINRELSADGYSCYRLEYVITNGARKYTKIPDTPIFLVANSDDDIYDLSIEKVITNEEAILK